MKLNKVCVNGDDEDSTKRFQSMCLIVSYDSNRCSRIWNDLENITLLFTKNYPKTTTSVYDVLCCYNKPTTPRQVQAPPKAVTVIQIDDTEKKNSPRKRWEIISRSHMLSLSGNMILCGKFPIINIQHPHWITITTGGIHHDLNHKGCTNL